MRAAKSLIIQLLILNMAAAGCATIRRAREAKNPDKVPPGERTVTAKEAGLDANTVLTMDRAIEIGLSYNPQVVLARQNLEIAESEYKNAIAGYLPSLQANASYRRATSNVSASTQSNDSRNNYSAGLSLGQLIFDFWKTPSLIKQACADRDAAQENLDVTTNDLTYEIKVAYYGLHNAQLLLEVAQDSVNQYQVHLDQVQELFNVGRLIKYEVTKAEVDLNNAQLNLLTAQNGLTTARATLNQSMGLAEDPGYSITEPPLDDIDSDLESLMNMAREKNPQLKVLLAREKAASAGIDAAIAALFPNITFNAGITWSGTSFPLFYNWSLGPAITWDLFNGFRNLNMIDEAAARLRIARANRAALEQQLYLDLSKAVAQLEEARQKMELTELIVTQSRENLELISERYRVGKASAVDVTDAEVTMVTARSNYVQARYDYQSAVAQIRHIIGGKIQ